MAIRVTLECGHASMLRVRTTPEGYTHDWEVFVRGVDNADISQYIDKVVFNLHETFQKPKRIFKEPPYLVKESGYAGFEIPIDVYLKNKDEPKRIQIQYDLQLQHSGPAINNVIRHHEVFNPSEEFRKKLLKGGGVVVSHPEDSSEKGEFKMVPPMVSKPKLSGTDVKKHRMTEVRSSDEFSDLFGNIMTLPKHVSPENKRALSDKIVSSKTTVEKTERTEKPVKIKHSPHKEKKKDKSSDERKDKKDRLLSKEKERHKEKLKRPPSPVSKDDFSNASAKKNSLPSPSKKHQLAPTVPPANPKPPSPRPKEKQHKKISVDKEKDKDKDKVKDNFKVPIEERMFDRKKKKHKEDKNKDRKEKDKDKDKEHDKTRDSSRGSEKKAAKPEKHERSDKERNSDCKVSKDGKKSPKYPKERDKVRSEKSSRSDTDKAKDSHSEREKQKHKHKRKDKKEKMEELTDKEKQEKHKAASEKKNSYAALTSANPLSTLLAEMPERDSSDSTHSVDEDSIPSSKSFLTPGSEPAVVQPPPVLCTDLTKPLSPRTNVETKNDGEDRGRKEKTKSARSEERECRKRKRKVDSGPDEHVVKREKDRGRSLSPSVEPVSSSQSPISIEINSPYVAKETTNEAEIHNRTESEQVTPDSTNSNFIEPEGGEAAALVFSDDYVSQLKDLQQKIMTLQDNQELQRVVQVIAETGQYEITRKTFDFDLCALDRTTVQRLQQFFSAS